MSPVSDLEPDAAIQEDNTIDGASTVNDGPSLPCRDTVRTIGPLKLRAKNDHLPQ